MKILENIGIENTGLGASALNNLITGNKSGIVGKYLNECAFTATGNTIIIDKGLLIICGRQVEIDAIESITFSSLPSEDARYQIVIELIREESGEVTASIFARQPSTLIQENLLKDGFVYQFELGRVTHKTTGQVTEVLRTADILYGQSGAGADIEVGEVNTQMISTELPAEVNINKTVDSGKTKLNFNFSLPKPYEDSVTGLVYSSQIVGNPVTINNTADGFVDKVKITNDTASAIPSPLTGKSIGTQLFDKNLPYTYAYGVEATVLPTGVRVTSTSNYGEGSYTHIRIVSIDLNYYKGKTMSVQYNMDTSGGAPGNVVLRRTNESGSTAISDLGIASGFTIPNIDLGDDHYLMIRLYCAYNSSISVNDYVDYNNLMLILGTSEQPYSGYAPTDFTIPLKDTSGTVLDLNPADVIEMIDGKYHLNDTELHDDSQDALRSIPTKQGQTNLIGDQAFTFDVTELAMGAGEKKYALLTDGDGNAVMPVNEADNTLMFDGRTVEQGLQELRKNIDKFSNSVSIKDLGMRIHSKVPFNERFEAKSWTGLTSFSGYGIWTDGTNIYYSYETNQYKLDVRTSTWSSKSWAGLTSFRGSYIWTDGTNIYYSYGIDQYVLDVATSTWSSKSWTGLTSFRGDRIWTDGTNIYYSYGIDQYVLDVATSTWSSKSWTGLTSFRGDRIWTDGTNIYYSYETNQYKLDVRTSTWSSKSWAGLTNFAGILIWTDGTNIYYSYGIDQYVLDVATSTWSSKSWAGLTSFRGDGIWTDGTNIYYSYEIDHYKFIPKRRLN